MTRVRIHPKDISPSGEGSRLNADLLDGKHWRDIEAYIEAKVYEIVNRAMFERGKVMWEDIVGVPTEIPAHTHASTDLIWVVKRLTNGRVVVLFNDKGTIKIADVGDLFPSTVGGGSRGNDREYPQFVDADGNVVRRDPRNYPS